jgi:hypothetical protein
MKKRFLLFLIPGILFYNISLAQDQFISAIEKPKVVSDDPVKSPIVFEFKGYSKDSELNSISAEMAGKHPFGELVAKKLYLLDEIYTSEVPLVPGNPQTRVYIKKPVIYETVRRIERDLKRSVKKGEISVEVAEIDFNKVLDVALNILTADTKKFENAIESSGSANSRIALFTKMVNLKY